MAAEKLLPIFLNQPSIKEIENGLDYKPEDVENALRVLVISYDSTKNLTEQIAQL